jgi:haloalkane dehalogenase
MECLRTPDDCFQDLPGYDYPPHYLQVDDTEGGEPSWSYLYRKMIPLFVEAGHRVIAPDLPGFGRSDKPARRSDYTYQRHVDWMQSVFDQLALNDVTLVCQDWGGLIGLRLVAANPDRFARVVAANTLLPNGEHHPGDAFMKWQKFSQETPTFPVGMMIQGATTTDLPPEIMAAYDAPFPDESYKEGARQFPMLVPVSPDDPAAEPNKQAWEVLMKWDKPFLTAFSDKDPITRGGEAVLQKLIPGARGQPHTTIENGGHFLQEDQGEKLAEVTLAFIKGA